MTAAARTGTARRSHDGVTITAEVLRNPRPPFQVTGVRMIYLEGRLRAGVVLPAGLATTPTRHGAIGLYEAAGGWGISPFAGTYARAAVEGHEAPDGSEAFLYLAGSYTGRAGDILPDLYHSGWGRGQVDLRFSGNDLSADCDLGPECRIRLSGTVKDGAGRDDAGAHRELGLDPAGRLREWVTGWACRVHGLSLDGWTLTVPPGHLLHGFQLIEASLLVDKSFTLGEPRPSPAGHLHVLAKLHEYGLTPAEARIALTLGQGGTARDAAASLSISPHTVRSTLKTIYGKLEVNNRAALGAWIERLTRT